MSKFKVISRISSHVSLLGAGGLALIMSVTAPAFAQNHTYHVSFGAPGIPPVWLSAPMYVAKAEGFYKKFGVNVTLRPFSSGAAAGRAVAAGSVDTAIVPAAPLIKMVSNAGAPLVAVWGMEHPDWIVGSMSKKLAKCKDMQGHGVGVDSVGGARWIQMVRVLRSCHLSPKDVKVVSLSSNVDQAMAAGSINYGVLHLSDVPVIERKSGKKVYVVKTIQQIEPGTEFTTLATSKSTMKRKREAIIRMLAGVIAAIHYMQNPAHFHRVAEIVHNAQLSDSGNIGDAVKAVKKYDQIHYWPVNSNGLSKARLDKTARILKKVGAIKKGKEPASYSRLTDTSLWKQANALYKKTMG